MTRTWRHALCAALAAAAAMALDRTALGAQTALTDSLRCDSVLAAAKVDSVATGMFVVAGRLDGSLEPRRLEHIAAIVGASFVPPRPFKLSVFTGPARMRMFRPIGSDSASMLRAPSVIGIYRLVVTKDFAIERLSTVRASLMPGFDSAAVTAVRDAVAMRDESIGRVPGNSMQLDIRLSTDSTSGAVRIASAWFPRMPVIDAGPLPDNPPAAFPEDEKADSVATGEVVLRFVVDRTGTPALETLQIVRGSSISFVRSAIEVMPKQRFTPATIHGCAVAQTVDYPFSFVLPHDPQGQSSPMTAPIRH